MNFNYYKPINNNVRSKNWYGAFLPYGKFSQGQSYGGCPLGQDGSFSYASLASSSVWKPQPLDSVAPNPQCSLSQAILKQIEYYFSKDNLVKDVFLRSKMDVDGWVSIHLIATFPRVKAMTSDTELILKALQPSKVIEINGDKIRRLGDWKRWVLPSVIALEEHSPEGLLEN